MSWRFRSLTRHGIRNARADVGRSVTIALFAAALSGLITQNDLVIAGGLRNESQDRAESGLYVLQATSEIGLDAEQCERLGGRAGFAGSGGLRSGPLVLLDSDGLTQIPTGEVTMGLLVLAEMGDLDLLIPDRGGVILGGALARQLRLSTGASLGLRGELTTGIVAVLAETGRTRFISGWLLVVTPPLGHVDECWIETMPGNSVTAEAVVRSVFGGVADVEIRPMIRLDDRSRDLKAEWRTRSTRDLLRLALVTSVALGFLLTVVRRSEFGLYRALGMQRTHLMLVVQVETLVVVSIGSIFGIIWSVALFLAGTSPEDPIPPTDLIVAVRDALAVPAWMAVVLPAAVLVSRGSIMDALKDR